MKRSFFCLLVILSMSFYPSFSQVNPQNGAAQINIPLYSYSDPGNRLGLNASLVYLDGNGLKVSEMASAVGTGWTLDCGGSISRIQHGAPDDQKYTGQTFDYSTPTGYANYEKYYYPDGYLYNQTYTASDIIDNGGGYTPYKQFVPFQNSYKRQPQYLADREQDVFAFTFNGHAGEFVIGKNKQVRTLTDSKLKIDLQETDMSSNGIRTKISQFKITDESGIQYIFKDMRLDYVSRYEKFKYAGNSSNPNYHSDLATLASATSLPDPLLAPSLAAQNNTIYVIEGEATTQTVVDKWYLSQIINPYTNKQITFNYTSFNEDINTDKLIEASMTGVNGSVTVVWQRYKAIDKRLSSVILSNSERIDLTYASTPRIDLPHQNTLNQLKVSYNESIVYAWNLGYGYFVGTEQAIKTPTDSYSGAEQQWARLCLLTLQKTGLNNKSEPPYRFTYNMGGDNGGGVYILGSDVIPPMFSIYQDHFGYYNGDVRPEAIPEGSYNSFYSSAALKILLGIQPGTIHNGAYKVPILTVAKNGIIKSVTYPLGGTLSFEYEKNTTSQMQLGGVRVKTTNQYDGISHANDIVKQYNYVNADGSSSGWGGETYSYISPMTIVSPNCTSGAVSAISAKELVFNYLEQGALFHTFTIASASAMAGSAFASMAGSLEGMVVSVVVMVLLNLFGSDPGPAIHTVNEYSNFSSIANNPLPWGYARTEVVNLLSADNVGKTVYEFSYPGGAGDPLIEVTTPAVLFSGKPRYAPWVYGLPKTITISDKNNNNVKQTINHYNYIVNTLNDVNFLSKSWTATQNTYGCLLTINFGGSSSDISQETYYPLTGHTELKSSDEIIYNSQLQQATVTTNYEYDANYQLKRKYFNNSKGETIETLYYHPYDYTSAPGAIASMNTAASNIFSPVLSTETNILKSGTPYTIGGSNTDFDIFSNGDIKPKFTYSFQNTLPMLKSSIQSFSPASVLRDAAYYKQIALYDYDNYGNLVQTLTGGNKVSSNIYDYDGKLMVASVSNASYSDIGYSSFEAQGGKAGSWVNPAAIFTDDARTGTKSFNLSDPSNPVNNYFGFGGLNGGLTYIVSFWSKNGTACLNGSAGGTSTLNSCQGTAGWKQGVTINGWTYNEKQVSNIDKVSVSGTGLVDEFRIYPVGSQMTTTTYTPLIGKTSECDASGRVTYYTYDDLGRLIKISDDQRNVIRTYEYNYKQ